jgi:hypothetical protein
MLYAKTWSGKCEVHWFEAGSKIVDEDGNENVDAGMKESDD